jgi:hypothetical protein
MHAPGVIEGDDRYLPKTKQKEESLLFQLCTGIIILFFVLPGRR